MQMDNYRVIKYIVAIFITSVLASASVIVLFKTYPYPYNFLVVVSLIILGVFIAYFIIYQVKKLEKGNGDSNGR
jgi:hypothetical protein